MPATEWGWLIAPAELESWILHQDADVLVVNKPGSVVCHPSKHGPWSSLVGAVREYLGVSRVHLPSRLDRETSGVVVAVKNSALASRLQRAVTRGRAANQYLAILRGELGGAAVVDRPLSRDREARIWFKQRVVEPPEGAAAETRFEPLVTGGGYSLVRVRPRTGRLHQIRVHAAWLGFPVAGDKIYGGDEGLYLEFVRTGYTQELAARLGLPRQALHREVADFEILPPFRAPLPADMDQFCRKHLPAREYERFQSHRQTEETWPVQAAIPVR